MEVTGKSNLNNIGALVNDKSRPLLFIGSSSTMFYFKDVCDQHGIEIAGIIDNDYYGNVSSLEGIPVIDTEISFEDPDKLKYYRENFNFFLATNYVPQRDNVMKRNVQKKFQLMNLIDQYDLSCITLIDKDAKVHYTCTVGKNVFLDAMIYVSGYTEIGDYSSIYTGTCVGHHNKLGRNCVLQRKSGLHNYNVLEDNVFVGLASHVMGENLMIRQGTFVHPCLVVRRDTQPEEVISLVNKDLRKIYHRHSEQ
jgi:carbonic anhydrase/acetyltransferase-like protein (isoleucine patch superfamily)